MVLLPNGKELSIPVRVIGGTPLRVTVCATDPAGNPPIQAVDPPDLMLVNDFSVKVLGNGQTHQPYVLDPANPAAPATNGINSRDNVEQVLIPTPIAGGDYQIVLGQPIGETFVDDLGQPAPHRLAVIISGIESNPALEFKTTTLVRSDIDEWSLVWQALVGCSYRIQQSTTMAPGSWTDLSGDLLAEASVMAYTLTADPNTQTKTFWRVIKLP